MEQWRPVVGYEESYEVSDQGAIRSHRFSRRHGFPYKPHLLTVQRRSTGYEYVMLRDATGVSSGHSIHRLVAAAFLPPPADDQVEVHHIDGVRYHNAAVNLAWISVLENRRRRRPPTRPRYAELHALIALLGLMNARQAPPLAEAWVWLNPEA